MDVWSAVLRRRFGIPRSTTASWAAGSATWREGDSSTTASPASTPIRGERAPGWVAHYSIGVTLALLLPAIVGRAWLTSPTIWPALAIGLATIVAPWFVMQPAMGVGFCGSQVTEPESDEDAEFGDARRLRSRFYVAAAVISVAGWG